MAEATSGGGGTYIDPLVGARLGGYLIEAPLGRGAMGAVYRAVQMSLNRRVALKVMVSHLSGRADLVARFRREAMAAAALNHPNIVQVHDFGEDGGVCFYVMELIDGLSLGDYLNRGERFSERELIEVGREVTLALQAAHEAGIIHRDIKPDNLMLNGAGMVKLADLGLARVHDLDSDVALTLSGVSMGTPLYMSPEQAQGEKTVDHRADFYALGATLFHLATGRVPFEGQTAGAILGRQLAGHVPAARAFSPSLGQGFSDLLRWMMATHPVNRPNTHAQILEALERCLADAIRRESAGSLGTSRIVSSTVAPAPRPEMPAKQVEVFVKQGKGWPIWAGCGAAFAAILVAGWFATRPAAEPVQVSTTKDAEITKPVQAMPAAAASAPAPVEELKILGDLARLPAAPPTPPPAAASPAAMPVAQEAEKKPEAAAPTPPPVMPASTAAKPLATPQELMSATKERPFVNSLGMKFVPIPGTKVLFCIWETRVRDFEAFLKESGYKWDFKPPFEQTPDHPAVAISWDDAKAFCAWLGAKEGLEYRLPTDEEWHAAAGKDEFPWGDDWPPPEGIGNFAGEELKQAGFKGPVLEGHRDDHPWTAPVGSYKPNRDGLYDFVGNVQEFNEDWYTEATYNRHMKAKGFPPFADQVADYKTGTVRKVNRGACWRSPYRSDFPVDSCYSGTPDMRRDTVGFRCVLVLP
ncbi:MAG TPA: bifunctional serine/threonine-protein kinase/formylglycine-generating enzyme family protein [Verrucomicrobiae bacterium]|nr:bifunctional serine/threonine-protein kinase/formylglycine-generating enzyme family protein [Verrucomicrobiae bacterium]